MAFYNCTNLSSITIPVSVISIGYNAFNYCTSLTDVYYGGTEDDWNSIKISDYNECLTNATIHYNSYSFSSDTNTDNSSSGTQSGSSTDSTVSTGGSSTDSSSDTTTTTDTTTNSATANAVTTTTTTASSTSTATASVSTPKKTSVKKATSPKKKQIKVTWKKKANVTGYQVQYATNKKFTKNKKTVTVKGAGKTSKTIKKLKSKKTYYVRVRTYKTVNGKKVYSKWSAVKKVTVK